MVSEQPRVLIVEDSPTQARAMQLVLVGLGYEVAVADSVAASLEQLREPTCDVVLLDLLLPDATRLEGLAALAALIPDKPILVLTAVADRDLAMEALQLGAQDYLIKGQAEPELLDRTIRYAIERKRATHQLEKLAQELAAKNRELEQLNEQKNQMLGVIAHDLRNPLGVTHLYGQLLLRRKTNLTEAQLEYIDCILSSNRFMRQLVDDVLDVSKIELGKLHLQLESSSMQTLIEQNLELNSVLAEEKELEVDLWVEGEIPPVRIDALKVQQVLNNLIGNAIKFSHPHSHIVIHLSASNGFITVKVSDQGVGIPDDHLGELFKPFAVVSRSGTFGERGSGLGLAITRKIVEGHGGRVWAESEEDKGARFYFTVPVEGPPDDA